MKKPIILFISFSLGAHLLIGLWFMMQPDYNLLWQSSNNFSIQLTERKTDKKTKEDTVKKEEVSHIQKIEKKPVQDTSKKISTKIDNKLKQEDVLRSSTPRSKIIAQLKNKLADNFYYPRLAQQQNWQGKVILSFSVNTSGKISQIEISHSSGFAILDNAAIKAMLTVNTLTSISLNKKMNIQLPVIYKLFEG